MNIMLLRRKKVEKEVNIKKKEVLEKHVKRTENPDINYYISKWIRVHIVKNSKNIFYLK